MKLQDQQRIEASRERVFDALNDPEILKQCIPGCESLEKVGDNELEAVAALKIGPVKARFKGKVTLSNIVPPESYTITGEGSGGAAGFAKGGADVRLEADGPEATVLHYDVKAEVAGKIAQLGGRLIDSTAKRLAGQFFETFSTVVAPPPQEAREATDTGEPVSDDQAPGPGTAGDVSQAGPALASAPPPSASAAGQDRSAIYVVGGIAVLALVLSLVALAS